MIGWGSNEFDLAFYVANRPNFGPYPEQSTFYPLMPGELDTILANTNNHWKKLFNVLAKVMQAYDPQRAPVWQDYRDQGLLRAEGREALLFSEPEFNLSRSQVIHIVAGKTYAKTLANIGPLVWLDTHFAVNQSKRVIVTPYLDYRQLSNERIQRLVEIIRHWPQN